VPRLDPAQRRQALEQRVEGLYGKMRQKGWRMAWSPTIMKPLPKRRPIRPTISCWVAKGHVQP
jgi:hypothetical protein